MTVLEKCKIGELHVMMGFGNHVVFFNELSKENGKETAMKWPISQNVVSVIYHDQVIEGNACMHAFYCQKKF